MLAAPFIQKVPIVGNKQWNSMKIGEKIDLTFPKIEMISGETKQIIFIIRPTSASDLFQSSNISMTMRPN